MTTATHDGWTYSGELTIDPPLTYRALKNKEYITYQPDGAGAPRRVFRLKVKETWQDHELGRLLVRTSNTIHFHAVQSPIAPVTTARQLQDMIAILAEHYGGMGCKYTGEVIVKSNREHLCTIRVEGTTVTLLQLRKEWDVVPLWREDDDQDD